jgi:hypothetical protein
LIKVMLSPLLMVIDDWTKFVAFICTWFGAELGAVMVALQATRITAITTPQRPRMANSFFDMVRIPFVAESP